MNTRLHKILSIVGLSFGTLAPSTVFALPEIDVVGYRDGQAKPVTFATSQVGSPGASVNFTVKNLGNKALLLGPLTVNGGFVVTAQPARSVAPKRQTTFAVQLPATQAGTYSGDLSLSNNDANENPFNLHLSGVVDPAQPKYPELELSVNGNSRQSLDPTPVLVSAWQGASSQAGAASITMRNSGRANLTLSGWNLSPGFVVRGSPNSTVAPGRSVTVTVSPSTSSLALRTGKASFRSNDADEGLSIVPLRGKVFQVPTYVVGSSAIAAPGGTITITDSTPASYSIEPANGRVGFGAAYVIVRSGRTGTSRLDYRSDAQRVVFQGARPTVVDNFTSLQVIYR